jgi:hypothetical protein
MEINKNLKERNNMMNKITLIKLGCKGTKIARKSIQTATTMTAVEVIKNQDIEKDEIVLSKTILKRRIISAMAGTIAAEVVDAIIDQLTDNTIVRLVSYLTTDILVSAFVEKKLKEMDEKKRIQELEEAKRELAELKANQNKED